MTDSDIKQQVAAIKSRLSAEFKRHEKALKKMKLELGVIQKECPHNSTHYEPDPSGNNDSSMECLVCGKEARRL